MKQLVMLFTLVFALTAALSGCGAAPQSQTAGDLTVSLGAEPAVPLAGRPTTLRVRLEQAGQPLKAERVTFQRWMVGMEHQDDQGLLIGEALDSGQYAAETSFDMGGSWKVKVTVAGAEGKTQALTFPVEVEQP